MYKFQISAVLEETKHDVLSCEEEGVSGISTRQMARIELIWDLTASSPGHAMATFWRKYAQRCFAISGPFKDQDFRDEFPMYARVEVKIANR